MSADQLFSDLPVASERAGAGSLDPSTTSTERRNDLVTGSTDVAAGGERARLEGEAGRASSLPAVAPVVLGVDLSLTGTGVATLGWSTVFGTAPAGLKDQADDLRRIRLISAFVLDTARKTGPRLVVMEGPSFDSSGGHAHSRAGLWWKVYDTLADWHYSVAVITPSQLKLYALGKGAGKETDKAHVLAACVRTFAWYAGANDNSADAIWLAAMGADHLGHPFVQMPTRNRTALDKVAWPEGVMS